MPGTQVGDGDGAGGATTGVKVDDGEVGGGIREVVGVPVAAAEGDEVGVLDGDAGTVAVADADVPLERVAVGDVEITLGDAVLDGDAPRLSDAVAVCVSVLLLEPDGVAEKVGVTDGDAPRDSDAVADCDGVAVVAADLDSVAVAVLDADAPLVSDAVDVGVRVAFCEPVGVRVAFCVPVSDGVGVGDGVCDGVKGTHARSVAKPGSAGFVHDVTLVSAKPSHVAMVGDTHDEPPPPAPWLPETPTEPAPPPK